MKLNVEDLPICEEVITGHFYYNKEGDKIEKGDVIQIIAPKSKFHKWICIFDYINDNSIHFMYNSGGIGLFRNYIWPGYEYLTWDDFRIVKLNSLEEAEK